MFSKIENSRVLTLKMSNFETRSTELSIVLKNIGNTFYVFSIFKIINFQYPDPRFIYSKNNNFTFTAFVCITQRKPFF